MRAKINNYLTKLIQTAVRKEFEKIQEENSYFKNKEYILERYMNFSVPHAFLFDYSFLKNKTLSFIESMKFGREVGVYKYSDSTNKPTIYSSVYACLILSLYDQLTLFEENEKKEWIEYFDSFQSAEDGLFYDSIIRNDIYDQSDWWGARHLALHIISAYEALGAKPKYPFKFLEFYYNDNNLLDFLESINWNQNFTHENDIDNKIMNIGCLLQYSRDKFNDKYALNSINFIIRFLQSKININTGLWGNSNLDNPKDLSRMIQFAYHVFSLFFFDNIEIGNKQKILSYALKTQNVFGGFGNQINSSACEDIDSIDIITRISKNTAPIGEDVHKSISKALFWVLTNMNDDGGFVFRRNEGFEYGHSEMYSAPNESSMFATWFRTLSLVYISNFLSLPNFYNIAKVPGYQYL